MSEQDDRRRELLARIEARRAAVTRYLRESRPTIRRWANTTIVLTSLAAVFTAGPAFGGETFAGRVQEILRLPEQSLVWQWLCLFALLASVGAAVMTGLAKPQEAAMNRLATAEAAKAELEGLATLIQFGDLSVEDAVKLFQQYSVKVSFIDDDVPLHRQ